MSIQANYNSHLHDQHTAAVTIQRAVRSKYNKEYSLVSFNTPTIVDTSSIVALKISGHTLRSDLPEYQDSQFIVSYLKENTYEVTRLFAPNEATEQALTPLNPARALYVEDMTNENHYPEIIKIVRSWIEIVHDPRSSSLMLTENDQKEWFTEAVNISRLVAQCLENPFVTQCTYEIWDRIYLCKDEKTDKVQSIALTKDKPGGSIHLAHIVSSPQNIKHQNSHVFPQRVIGAGTALIHHLFQRAIKEEKEITLEATRHSKLYYTKKFGFEKDNRDCFEEGCIPMKLTVDKIRDYLAEKHLA